MWDKKIGNVRDTKLRPKCPSTIPGTDDARQEFSEPDSWTSYEAYQSMLGSLWSLIQSDMQQHKLRDLLSIQKFSGRYYSTVMAKFLRDCRHV